jgi:hypothetical protein
VRTSGHKRHSRAGRNRGDCGQLRNKQLHNLKQGCGVGVGAGRNFRWSRSRSR